MSARCLFTDGEKSADCLQFVCAETAAMMEKAMTKEETQRACMRIGDNIDRYLKRAGMTQRMLAAYADVTEVSISRYISGDRAPRATVLYKISKVLNCTMEDLMYGVFD